MIVVDVWPGSGIVVRAGDFGILPAQIATGGNFPSPLANDGPDAGSYLATDQIAWEVTSVPPAVQPYTSATDDGELVIGVGAPDGTYSIEYEVVVLRQDNSVYSTGGPFTARIGGRLRRRQAGSWVPALIRMFDGTAWVEKPVKLRGASGWT